MALKFTGGKAVDAGMGTSARVRNEAGNLARSLNAEISRIRGELAAPASRLHSFVEADGGDAYEASLIVQEMKNAVEALQSAYNKVVQFKK